MKPEYYHQKANVLIASWFSERLHTYLKKLGIVKNSLKYLQFKVNAEPASQKENFGKYVWKLWKINPKTLHKKTYFT